MKRLILLFCLLFLTFLLSVFIFPFYPTSIADFVGNGNLLNTANFKNNQLTNDSGQLCFFLNNNNTFNAKNYLIPLFKDIDYQLSIKSKFNINDTNAVLDFFVNDRYLTRVQITNKFWTSYSKTFKVKENIYGFGRDVPKFSIKCFCSNSNSVSIASFKISCAPFYKHALRTFSSKKTKENIDNITNLVYQTEIFKNNDFKQGLKYWNAEGNICLTNIGSSVYACVSHDGNKKSRIYQTINAVSGQIYRLSFDLLSSNKGAFVICRSHIGGKEKYYWCKKPSGLNKYSWEFVCSQTGKNSIYFDCINKGDYFYSNPKLVLINSKKRIFYETSVSICLVLFLFAFIFLLRSNCFN